MNNFDITQKIIFEKLSNHISEEMPVEYRPDDSATEIDKAYYYLNLLSLIRHSVLYILFNYINSYIFLS